ncbi:hypothetical protein [Kitasatospora sp. CB02891]|uniref:hypothetical protein n=1 Tax=Kitasatospora sp. CB02891 TaxID=2020329 RepID=UPI000C27D269|nr:hypothetical protein [Kitasatospora sp. CB02891]PJN22226.1 hypothetical protein CG736_29270 [Kitasatospora sp. CB02891]
MTTNGVCRVGGRWRTSTTGRATAARATPRCPTGCPTDCVVGGVRGRVIGVGFGLHHGATVVLPIAPAFVVTVPADRRPIRRGLGRAAVHAHR